MATAPTRYRFTVEEFERMAKVGIFHEDDHVELIEGEIIQMAPVGKRHASCISRLNIVLVPQVGERANLWHQSSIRIGPRSLPEPDIALLRYREDAYWALRPQAEDILLAIEVADSSLRYDRITKARLYAEHGIPELWVWDVTHRQVYVFRDPEGGVYRTAFTAGPTEVLEAVALPGLRVAVADGFGPEDA